MSSFWVDAVEVDSFDEDAFDIGGETPPTPTYPAFPIRARAARKIIVLFSLALILLSCL